MNTIDELTTLTQQLVNQPSLTPQDKLCQKIITLYLKKLNFHVESMNFHDTSNIWAYRYGKKKDYKKQRTLLFAGHTDVVPTGDPKNWTYPPFSGMVYNNILYGRGSSDMKGAIAAMLISIKNFVTKYPNHQERIACLFTSDEEGTGINGTIKVVESLMNRKEHIDYCIIGEPSSNFKLGDVIKNGRRGSYTGELTIFGSSGHVAYPKITHNLIHLSIPILLDLINAKWDQERSIFFPSTYMQITKLETAPITKFKNITPNQLILNFNFRFNDQSSIYSIKKNINKILSNYNLAYHINQEHLSEPYFSTPSTLANIVINTIKHYQKITPRLETTGGTSDGRFIIKTGAEIIELGVLNHTIHQVNESVNLIDLHLLSDIYSKIIKKIIL